MQRLRLGFKFTCLHTYYLMCMSQHGFKTNINQISITTIFIYMHKEGLSRSIIITSTLVLDLLNIHFVHSNQTSGWQLVPKRESCCHHLEASVRHYWGCCKLRG